MIVLSAAPQHLQAELALPSSKSESNRALIIQALAAPGHIDLQNLSSARDTQTMIRLLNSEGHVLDVIDAGTTMRFLTAYFSALGRDQILTGTPRMCQRPIGILVEALRELGAEIEYWKQDGFPPLHIVSKGQRMSGGEVSIPGNVSSQFISALLMIGAVLEGGLKINLTGDISSRPYIEMTRSLMAHFGGVSSWEGNSLIVSHKPYGAGKYEIESDWSAASYWYSFVALAEKADVLLKGLRENSFQGDQQIAAYMELFGVQTTYENGGVRIKKVAAPAPDQTVEVDFTEIPDMAQTFAVLAAAKGIPMKLTGLHTLRVKETDRIDALVTELGKFQVEVESGPDWLGVKGGFEPRAVKIHTYEDHRMAMAFGPLVMVAPEISFDDPSVVAKSYPEFWQHIEEAGIRVQEF